MPVNELTILNVEAAIRRMLDMYDRVLALHAEVDGDVSAIENARIALPCEFDRDDYQRTLLLFIIYDMYLQVKTLCPLSMHQLCL